MLFFATCPIGFSDLLETELLGYGAAINSRTVAGVGFSGPLECAYRACLWSRVANRILLTLDTFAAIDADELYSGVQRTRWGDHIAVTNSIAVDFTSTRSQINHTLYGAQRVKDAIVDQLRDPAGVRPDVDIHNPDLRINVHLQRDQASIAIDLSGESLHRRGYREDGGVAPLKENLAAALLLRAGWPHIAANGGGLLDPMCGSATLPIEALFMAADIAPNLARVRFGFERWRQHDADLWQTLRDEAATRKAIGLARSHGPIHGSDDDPRAIAGALANVERAGLSGHIDIQALAMADAAPPSPHGLLITNPPYGERLADPAELPVLFTALGEVLRARFNGWRAAVLAPDEELGFCTRLRLKKKNAAKNGAIDVVLLTFDVSPEQILAERVAGSVSRPPRELDAGIDAFRNRIRKNQKHFARWARQQHITCYRVYDADLPDYAFVVDLYRGIDTWLHVQEYAPPATVDEKRAQLRRDSVLAVLPELFDLDPANVFVKTRERKRGSSQYERQDDAHIFYTVEEDECLLRVNLRDYLDTGLFLDHRPLRVRIQQESHGKRFLNLFAYTGAATVHAARGGAIGSVSVDLSNTYLDWARQNLELNRADPRRHELVRDDCRAWVAQAARRGDLFDLILLDPPSYSNSKATIDDFEVQRDHVELIRACIALLALNGTLYFSTNSQRFKFDAEALRDLDCEDITRSTIAEDFRRSPRIHSCWRIRRRS